MKRYRNLFLAGACIWGLFWGCVALAQMPTLAEQGRRVDALVENVKQLERDTAGLTREHEKRLTVIETEVKAVREQLGQLNSILMGLLGTISIGGGGLGYILNRKSAQQRKRDTPVG